ncbi:ATP-binding protein [Streptomyces sp. H10-C2]|uniref:ATP-binding protein n=1 Tax=unclassified Streptomyces TaxID=2593676 RepID=UPI0024B881D3|nr:MULTISPECIES: ATP-binding protein [unclassified Streptomyces]MDJ0342765.1 ATP-binding protein [Streptomyces sp. PH10-H1]MDJ0372443.1 ATP-binding protein [Streptomyces sp. H10-C2]
MATTATDPQQTGRCGTPMPRPLPEGLTASFPPEPVRVGQIRRLATEQLAFWNIERCAGVVALVASEMVTNALHHGGGHDIVFALWYFRESGEVRIDVADGSSERPVVLSPDGERESGRGMVLVDALTDRWSISPDGTNMQATVAVESCAA